MLSDLTLRLVTALRDRRFVLSPPNHMVGASFSGALDSDVRESSGALQPLSRLLCAFWRFKRNKATATPTADGGGEKKVPITAGDDNGEIQQPWVIESCRVPRPIQ